VSETSSSIPPLEPGPPLIVVTPNVARPGQVVELRYPNGLPRGLALFMSRWESDRWSEPQFLLFSDAAWWTDGPSWHPRGSNWSWRNLGVGGPGPDRIKVPEVAGSGVYRICTAGTGDTSHCVQLTVSA
jgi:hypothetical protein